MGNGNKHRRYRRFLKKLLSLLDQSPCSLKSSLFTIYHVYPCSMFGFYVFPTYTPSANLLLRVLPPSPSPPHLTHLLFSVALTLSPFYSTAAFSSFWVDEGLWNGR